MVEYESECNGCSECRFCGRNARKRAIFRCDECGDAFEPKELKHINNKHICLECYLEIAQGEWDDAQSPEE